MALGACACAILAAGMFLSTGRDRKTAAHAVESQRATDRSDAVQPALMPSPLGPDPALPPVTDGAASVHDPNPLTPPLRPPDRAPTAMQTSPAGLRISGSVPVAPGTAALAEFPADKAPEPSHGEVGASGAPEPPAVTTPTAPAQPSEDAGPPEPVEADTAKPSSPKRRNVVVRVFQKVFHPRPKATDPAAPSGEVSGIRPPGTDPAKQPQQ